MPPPTEPPDPGCACSVAQMTAQPGNLLAVAGFVTSCLLLLQFFLLRATLQSTASRHSL